MINTLNFFVDISIILIDPLEQFDADLDFDFEFIDWFFPTPMILQVLASAITGVTYIYFDEIDIFEEDFDDFSSDVIGDTVEDEWELDLVDDFIGANFSSMLLLNLLGMFPFAGGANSSIIAIFGSSLFFILSINIYGVLQHGFKFFSIFLPHGTPILMAPFIVVIEMISYFARVFSLSIRLFANLMSGHTLLKILLSFAFGLLILSPIFSVVAIFPIVLILIIFCLETLIGLLQAYVYSLLLGIYVSDVHTLH